MVRLLPLFLLAASLSACGPSVPDRGEARAWFEADAAKIRSFDERTRRHIGVEALLSQIEQDDPSFLERATLRERARATFRETGLPALEQEAGALGVEIRLLDGSTDTGILAGAGASAPARKDGSVLPEDGEEIDEFHLGWGVYTVDTDEGGTREVPGYEVYWEKVVEGRNLSFRLYMPGH